MAYMKKNKFKTGFKLQSCTYEQGHDRQADSRAARYTGM